MGIGLWAQSKHWVRCYIFQTATFLVFHHSNKALPQHIEFKLCLSICHIFFFLPCVRLASLLVQIDMLIWFVAFMLAHDVLRSLGCLKKEAIISTM